MIRIEESDGWLLIEHRDHARLAGFFASHWQNAGFPPPEPRADVLVAVSCHDDAWAERDAAPLLTREGRPSAFSHELVGTYSAFEEIDLAGYLGVRGRAAEVVARENPYAGIVVSMHTVNLLTEQAHLASLTPAQRELHKDFITGQRERQADFIAAVAAHPGRGGDVTPDRLRRAFEFLQACDSLSLIVCVNFPEARPLRHRHPRIDGTLVTFTSVPLGEGAFSVEPWPFDQPELRYTVPARRVTGKRFDDLTAFRAAFAAGHVVQLPVALVR